MTTWCTIIVMTELSSRIIKNYGFSVYNDSVCKKLVPCDPKKATFAMKFEKLHYFKKTLYEE